MNDAKRDCLPYDELLMGYASNRGSLRSLKTKLLALPPTFKNIVDKFDN